MSEVQNRPNGKLLGTARIFCDGRPVALVTYRQGDHFTAQYYDSNGHLVDETYPFGWQLWSNFLRRPGYTYTWKVNYPAWIETQTRQSVELFDVYVRSTYPEGDDHFEQVLTFVRLEDAELAVKLLSTYDLYKERYGMTLLRLDYERGYHPEGKSMYAENFEFDGKPRSAELTDAEYISLVETDCLMRRNLAGRLDPKYRVQLAAPSIRKPMIGKRQLAGSQLPWLLAIIQKMWLEIKKLAQ